ncbi:flagellar protein G [Desmospora sp. 8437]|nr:flagellar protein G [Desmospora sp. 8437]
MEDLESSHNHYSGGVFCLGSFFSKNHSFRKITTYYLDGKG